MKIRQYQILIKQTDGLPCVRGKPGRWTFIAHGSAYDRPEALETVARYAGRGYKTKLLPI